MKAVVERSSVRSSHPGGVKADGRCVAGKTSPTKSDFDSTEMRACFSKLQELVPSINHRDGKIDKTELLQHVIDYILDLEDTLALTSNGLCGVMDTATAAAAMSGSRQPLAEKSGDYNIKEASIKMAGGDLVALSTMASTIEDFDFRPPSK
ncbi:DNA-binding protein inhibitor ID-1-like [Babylonia areolata]|uniref:DNA-binding protein inhibitor ID-1-like n=1 Tax=Babylonia areolata TaxID=304850 RepID=UPI003FD2F0AF